jgi:hypothetical protein
LPRSPGTAARLANPWRLIDPSGLRDFPVSAKQQIRIDIGPDFLFGPRWPLAPATLPRSRHLRSAAQLLIQSEFNVLKAILMAVPRIVAIFPVSARVQPDDPISRAAGIQHEAAHNASRPQNEER